jgi:hypothetical protein
VTAVARYSPDPLKEGSDVVQPPRGAGGRWLATAAKVTKRLNPIDRAWNVATEEERADFTRRRFPECLTTPAVDGRPTVDLLVQLLEFSRHFSPASAAPGMAPEAQDRLRHQASLIRQQVLERLAAGEAVSIPSSLEGGDFSLGGHRRARG